MGGPKRNGQTVWEGRRDECLGEGVKTVPKGTIRGAAVLRWRRKEVVLVGQLVTVGGGKVHGGFTFFAPAIFARRIASFRALPTRQYGQFKRSDGFEKGCPINGACVMFLL